MSNATARLLPGPLRHFGELYRYREVLYLLIGADMKVRYRRTALGYLWGLLNPLLTIAILTFVFSQLMRFNSTGEYVLYVFAGLLPWQFFVNSVIGSSTTIIVNEPVLKKVYLPKLLFPMAAIAARFVDFLFNLLAVFLIVACLCFKPSWALLALPAALALLVALTTSLAIAFAALTVYLRDTGHLLMILTQLGFYLTPIVYPAEVVPEAHRWVLQLNPLTHIIGLFQQIVHRGEFPSAEAWGLAVLVTVTLAALGLGLFHMLERELIFRL